ncbi:hypothetical protein V8C86DRAFT_2512528 [Haematococcus lacustris]
MAPERCLLPCRCGLDPTNPFAVGRLQLSWEYRPHGGPGPRGAFAACVHSSPSDLSCLLNRVKCWGEPPQPRPTSLRNQLGLADMLNPAVTAAGQKVVVTLQGLVQEHDFQHTLGGVFGAELNGQVVALVAGSGTSAVEMQRLMCILDTQQLEAEQRELSQPQIGMAQASISLPVIGPVKFKMFLFTNNSPFCTDLLADLPCSLRIKFADRRALLALLKVDRCRQ